MQERIRKIFNIKYMAIFLIVIYLISLIPLCAISKYNYPSADDYSNGAQAFHLWEETHSLGSVLVDGIRRAANEYLTWRGCYTSSFLSAMPPCIFGQQWTFLTPIIALLLLSFGVIYLVDCIAVKMLNVNRNSALCVSMLMLIASVQGLPSEARCEFLYWYSGACNYAYIHAFALFFYGLLIATAKNKGKKQVVDLILCCIMAFLVAGGNQMSALNGAIIVLTIAAIITWNRQWKKWKILCIPIAVYLISFVVSIVSPGNFVRMGEGASMGAVKAILVSLFYTFSEAVNKWTTWSVLLLEFMMIPFFWAIAKKVTCKLRYPIIVVAFGYGVVSAMMTPPLFAVSNIEAGRIRGLVYWMYILVLTLCIGYCVIWFYQKLYGIEEKAQNQQAELVLSWSWSCYLLSCALFFVLATGLTLIPDSDYFTSSSAVTDMRNGTAQGFAEEMQQRLDLYLESKDKVVEVHELENQPELLFFSDLKPDSTDWENMAVAKYYKLKEVIWLSGQ